MTKLLVDYNLERILNDDDSEAIARVQGCYGIQKLEIAKTLDRITVGYDAARLTTADVHSVLVGCGIPALAPLQS